VDILVWHAARPAPSWRDRREADHSPARVRGATRRAPGVAGRADAGPGRRPGGRRGLTCSDGSARRRLGFPNGRRRPWGWSPRRGPGRPFGLTCSG